MIDELERVRDFRSVEPLPSEAARAAARSALSDAIAKEATTYRSPLRRRRPPRLRTLAIPAGAAAALAIMLMFLLPIGASGPSPAAAAVLLHAARVAAKQPATAAPTPGQYVYSRSEGVLAVTTVPDGGAKPYNAIYRYTRQQWIAPDGSGRILQTAGSPQLATSADRAAWIADGKPNLNDGSGNIHTTFGPQPGSYVNLSTVPTEPGALKQLIEQRKLESGPPGDAETFTIIGDLLRDSYAPPVVRSALYTVAAQLPGVQLIGPTHDQLGRDGTAVGYTSHGNTQELIFDPQTSALLAEQTIDNTGTVVGWTAYLASGIVDSISATVSTAP